MPYSMRVRVVAPPSNISVYRGTSAMEHIFRDKRVPYSMWVEIATRFLTRHAT